MCSVHVVGLLLILVNETLFPLVDLVLFHGSFDFLVVEELGESFGNVRTVAEADLLVKKVALQDRVCASVKDLNEDRSDHVGEKEDDQERSVRVAHLNHSLEDEEADQSCHDGDEELGNEHEAAGNSLDEAEFGSVLQDEKEGVDGGGAVALTGEGTVDVRVAVEVSDETIEAVKAAAAAADDCFGASVVA